MPNTIDAYLVPGRDIVQRVCLNGKDVTRRFMLVQGPTDGEVEGPGLMILLKQRGGQFYADRSGHAARETVKGLVRWHTAPMAP